MAKTLAATFLVLGAVLPHPALLAQRFFGFGGVEARAGVADPKNADKGFDYAIDADLGYIKLPNIRTYVGLDGFSSDVNLVVAGTRVDGSIKGFGLETGTRLDLTPGKLVSPSVVLGLSFTDVSARDVNEPATSDLLDGFYTAFVYGVGLALYIGQKHTWSAVGDLRFVTGSNVGRTVLTGGLRWNPKGRATYQSQSR